MRKVILITMLLLVAKTILFAQNHEELIDERPLNNISINLLGDASILSLNYERQFLISPTFILSGKFGFGYNKEFNLCIFGSCSPDTYFTIPHHITGNLGEWRNFFEFGFGGTILIGNKTQSYLLYPIVGYRFLPLKSDKISFRIYIQIPFSGLETNQIIFIPIGLNGGISF